MSPRFRTPLLALAVGVAALVLRLVLLNAGLWHTDSIWQARAVESAVLDGSFTYMHPPGYPGQVALGALFFWVHHLATGATSAAAAITVQSAVAGAVAAGLAVLLAKRLFEDDLAGFAAGLLLAVTPIFLSVTTFAKSHGSQAVFLLLAGIAAERAVPGRRLRAAILAGLALGFAASIRTESVLLVPALLVLLWRVESPIELADDGLRLRVPAAHVGAHVGALVGGALLVPALLYAQQTAAVGLEPFTSASSNSDFLGPFSRALTAQTLPALTTSFSWLGWPLLALGFVVAWRTRRGVALALTLWLVVMLVYLGNLAITVPRHLVPVVLPACLLMGGAVAAIGRRQRALAGAALVVVACAMVVPIWPVLQTRSRSAPTIDTLRGIAEHTEENAVIYAQDLGNHIRYVTGREVGEHAIATRDAGRFALEVTDSMEEIRGHIAAGRPVYVTSDAFSYDQRLEHEDGSTYFLKVGIPGVGESPAGEEQLGMWGVTLIGTVALQRVYTGPIDDWHGASLEPRTPKPVDLHLYRARIE